MGRNPKKKVYVDSKDADLDLARSVADVVEEKAQTKIKMQHSKASARANPEQRGRPSPSKSRLERAKAAVAAQAARAKREKTKQRKKARESAGRDIQNNSSSAIGAKSLGEKAPEGSGGKTKKRVTFG
ncbi:hypothetical protein C8Q74DRAFT_6675 [Fomes fomentarius]|nr:hypothetical protein C8Q74DRAFT_6675 [Fomes fomentarius]